MRVQYARELCRLQNVPLVELRCDYAKYGESSKDVQRILRKDFQIPKSAIQVPSMDEMYLDLTEVVRGEIKRQKASQDDLEWQVVADLVAEIRKRVKEKTNMSCSAGIGPNFAIAKMGSNVNKPNNQFCACLRTDVAAALRKAGAGKGAQLFHDPMGKGRTGAAAGTAATKNTVSDHGHDTGLANLSNAAMRVRLHKKLRRAGGAGPNYAHQQARPVEAFHKTDYFSENSLGAEKSAASAVLAEEEDENVVKLEDKKLLLLEEECAHDGPLVGIDYWLPTLPARAWPGIGPVTARLLDQYGIQTIDSLHSHRGLLWRLFTPAQAQLMALAGYGIEKVVEKKVQHKQSVGQERSFGREVTDVATVKQRLQELALRISEELKAERLQGRTLTLRLKKAKTFDYKAWSQALRAITAASGVAQQGGPTGSLKGNSSAHFSSDWKTIYANSVELLDTAWKTCPHGVWLAGLTVTNCKPLSEIDLTSLSSAGARPLTASIAGGPSVREFFKGEQAGAGVVLAADDGDSSKAGREDQDGFSTDQIDASQMNNPDLADAIRENLGRGNSSLCARLWKLDSDEEDEVSGRGRRSSAKSVAVVDLDGTSDHNDNAQLESDHSPDTKRQRIDEETEDFLGDDVALRNSSHRGSQEILFGGEIVAGFDCDDLLLEEED
ncbi:unnamed protein product [Amoebophrya sp. A120]|nr:unnamed protein product [Amoebophrya sp. A120]|eukprot:GSA120T00002042001.1